MSLSGSDSTNNYHKGSPLKRITDEVEKHQNETGVLFSEMPGAKARKVLQGIKQKLYPNITHQLVTTKEIKKELAKRASEYLAQFKFHALFAIVSIYLYQQMAINYAYNRFIDYIDYLSFINGDDF